MQSDTFTIRDGAARFIVAKNASILHEEVVGDALERIIKYVREFVL